jgi:FtsZ-binding cell division protein ZapB
MANFEELKQKAKDTMETIADKSVELYKAAEEKTKLFAKITKLGAEITLEKGTLRKLYREIGKKYYELHKSAPEDDLAQTCAEVTSSLDTITAKQKQIEELKNSYNLGEKETTATDTHERDADVEIIIEEYDDPYQDEMESAPVKPSEVPVDEPADEVEDVISKEPPEFKM